MAEIALTLPDELLERLATMVADQLETPEAKQEGFVDVDGAAAFLASTPSAIRSLVKRDAIPFHKTPAGRLLFDRDELDAWARSG